MLYCRYSLQVSIPFYLLTVHFLSGFVCDAIGALVYALFMPKTGAG